MMPFQDELRMMGYGGLASYMAPSTVLAFRPAYPVESRGYDAFTHGTPPSGTRPSNYAGCRKHNAKAKRRAQKQGRKASR